MTTSVTNGDLPFASGARAMFSRLQEAIGSVVSVLSGETPPRPAEMSRSLGLDGKLAWRIARMVEAKDSLAAAQFVPGKAGMQLFLEAARQQGIPPQLIERVEHVFEEYTEYVRSQADNRRSFDAIVSSLTNEDRQRIDIEYRRSAFLGQSYIVGIQSRVNLASYMLSPSADGEMIDIAAMRGVVDLRRLRPGVPWRLGRISVYQRTDGNVQIPSREPISAHQLDDAGPDALPFMPEFCTKPLPVSQPIKTKSGYFEYLMPETDLGNGGKTTCVLGEVTYNSQLRYSESTDSEPLRLRFGSHIPSELLLFDLHVHQDLFPSIVPKLEVLTALYSSAPPTILNAGDEIPVSERVQLLGTGLDQLHDRDCPEYSTILSTCYSSLGWDPSRFNCFRVRIAYPPVPSAIAYSYSAGLAMRPAGSA